MGEVVANLGGLISGADFNQADPDHLEHSLYGRWGQRTFPTSSGLWPKLQNYSIYRIEGRSQNRDYGSRQFDCSAGHRLPP
jgi:hypothetical protein